MASLFFVAIITNYEHRAGELQGLLVHPLISNYAYMSDGQDHLSLSLKTANSLISGAWHIVAAQ